MPLIVVRITASGGYTEVFRRGGRDSLAEANTFVNGGLSWQTMPTEIESALVRDNLFIGATVPGLGGIIVRSAIDPAGEV